MPTSSHKPARDIQKHSPSDWQIRIQRDLRDLRVDPVQFGPTDPIFIAIVAAHQVRKRDPNDAYWRRPMIRIDQKWADNIIPVANRHLRADITALRVLLLHCWTRRCDELIFGVSFGYVFLYELAPA